MTLFVDASALIAIVANEPEAESLARQIFVDDDPLWSPLSCWESISGLRRALGISARQARDEIEAWAASRPLRLVEIGDAERRIALDAFERYGKSIDPTGLNFGDCFAYACARTNNARLLYKGDDFAQTDLA